MHREIGALFAAQDGLITRRQALAHLSEGELQGLLGRRWGVALPGVYSQNPGGVSSRQRVRAALLYAGKTAMLSDTSGLHAHRVSFTPADHVIHVLVADSVQRLSRDFVVLRRTTRLPPPVFIRGLPVAPASRAVSEFVLRSADERSSFAVAAAAVQARKVQVAQLVEEAESGPARGRPRLVRTIESLRRGVRSLPERDFMQLADRSRDLPPLLYNCLLRLPDGSCFSPDALAPDAALIHETNSVTYHAPEDQGGADDLFEMTQARVDRLVTAGFTVLGNAPSRIRDRGDQVIGQFEECYLRAKGRGLPPGVTILRSGPDADSSDVALVSQAAS